MSLLVCLGRHTVTGLISTTGRQFHDWSQDYKVFSESRISTDAMFDVIRREVLTMTPQDKPIIVAMDDTKIKKTGRKIHGTKYHRDPLSPPFHNNFIWGQRWLQMSAAMIPQQTGPARTVPIDFAHAPVPQKPKKKASELEWSQYKKEKDANRISVVGADHINQLREKLNRDEPCRKRKLGVVVDGGFTNKEVLRNIPEDTFIIGRIRKDSALHHPVKDSQIQPRGQKRKYGDRASTPEQLRQDASVPWQEVEVYAAGKLHTTQIKTMGPVLSRVVGYKFPLRIIVIRPLAYRLRKGSKILYRNPAYLVCTDPDMDLQEAVQSYIWRWDVEVNFRDEKQLIGVGESQVRTRNSVETLPAFAAAAYAMMLVAASKAFGIMGVPASVPPPKWYKKPKNRASTQDLIKQLRYELWGKALGVSNSSGFVPREVPDTKQEKYDMDVGSAVLYAVK